MTAPRVVRLADDVVLAVVVGGAALVPIVFTAQVADVFMTPKLVLLAALVGIGLAAAAVGRASGRRTPRPTLSVLVALFVGWVAIATAASRAPAVSAFGLYGRYDGLLSLVLMVAFGWLVVAAAWDRPERLEVVALGFIAGAVLAAVYVWIQQLDLDWRTWYDSFGRPVRRPQGALGNSNFSGAHQAIALSLAIGLAPRLRGWTRTSILAVVPLMVGAIWFTGSRAAILAVVAGAGVAGLLAPGALPRRVAGGAVVLGAAGIAASFAVIAAGDLPTRAPGLDVLRSGSLDVRRELWIGAARAIGANPMIGTGPDTFLVTYLEHRRESGAGFPHTFAAEPHNIFLDRGVELGVIGLGLFVAIVVVTLRLAIGAERRPLLAGFTAAFCAYLVQGTFSVDTVGLTVAAWLAIGAIVVLADPRVRVARAERRATDPGTDEPTRSLAPPTVVGIALILLVWLVGSVRPLTADRAARTAAEAGQGTRVAVDGLRQATDRMPVEPEYHVRLASQLVAAAARDDPAAAPDLLDEAERELQLALDLFPDHVGYLGGLADVERARAERGDPGALERAMVLLQRAREVDPYGWGTLAKMGEVTAAAIGSSDDPDALAREALGYYIRAAEINPGPRRLWVAIRNLAELLGDDELAARAAQQLAADDAP